MSARRAACCAALLLAGLPAAAAVGQEPAPLPAPSRSVERLGMSAQGRPIGLVRLGDPRAARKVLVVGCVHGDECAGRGIVELMSPGTGGGLAFELLLVRNLNPDGFARGRRQNARGVDLNRNAAEGHRSRGPPGSRFYAGHTPFSEPETRAIRALILRERPAVAIWYHQPLRGVDVPETGADAVARRYAKLAGMRVRPLPAYPGSLSRWVNARVRAGSSFVVELPPGPLSAAAAERHAAAIMGIASGD